jgi:hypothetical protein
MEHAPRKCLIEEWSIVYYSMSCAKQVENESEPSAYSEGVASGDRDKWISAMQEEMQSLEKNDTLDIDRLSKYKKGSAISGYFKEKNVCLPKSLQG